MTAQITDEKRFALSIRADRGMSADTVNKNRFRTQGQPWERVAEGKMNPDVITQHMLDGAETAHMFAVMDIVGPTALVEYDDYLDFGDKIHVRELHDGASGVIRAKELVK